MKSSVIHDLILKDWRLQRPAIIFSMLGGLISLAVLQVGGETAIVVGSVWFFVALVVLACMLPVASIINERKKQNLAFLMSLPISVRQYTTAKLLSSVGMFLAPWLTLMIGVVLLILVRGVLPHGVIPVTLILTTIPLVGFCLITGTALVGESEGWCIAVTVVCNSSYGLIWYFMTRVPSLMADLKSSVAVWNPTVLKILGIEFGLIVVTLWLSYYLQSRKRDFI